MAHEGWARVDDLLNAALARPAGERDAFVRERAGADQPLAQEVLSLLAHSDDTSQFLEPPRISRRHADISRRLGPYEILSVVGAGGMGVVYRARDSRLDRIIALKVLLPEIATNADALARFEREARAVASLSHPNILTIHDVGTHDGSAYAVMEFLDGSTLRAMLERGPLPVRKAVSLAVQIAHGLASAHDCNLVHRDLKPENIGLTRSGQVKILDFGLARAARPRSASASEDTVGQVISQAGVILGTVGYMSPEQVRGEDVDYRSDLFSFGAMLFEMVTGRRAFGRPTAAESMNAILNDDPPDFLESGAKAPPALERVIRRCLEKHAADRFHSARDLAFALENALVHGTGALAAVPSSRSRWALGGLAAVSLAVGAILTLWWPRPAALPWTATALTFTGADAEPAASPRGDEITYTSSRDGALRLYLRHLGGASDQVTHMLREEPRGPAGAHRPRYFSDGTRVLFLQTASGHQNAYELPLLGDQVGSLLIEDVSDAEPSPIESDEIAFVRLSVDAAGRRHSLLGTFNAASKREEPLYEEADRDFASVRWSPDGQQLALLSRSSLNATKSRVLVVSRASRSVVKTVEPQDEGAFGAMAWNGDGRSLIITQSQNARVFVPGALGQILKVDVASGKQTLLFRQANLFGLFGSADANASIDITGEGRLVFSTVEIHQNLIECEIVDSGCAQAAGTTRVTGTAGYSNDRQPAYSPNGDWLIYSSNRHGDLDLWVQSTRDGRTFPITRDREADWDPAFSDDGYIFWSRETGAGRLEIFEKRFDPSTLQDTRNLTPKRVSSDGDDAENPTLAKRSEWVVYASGNATHPGIWRVRADGRDARVLVPGSFLYLPETSPDGRYVAYLRTDSVRQVNVISVVEMDSGRDTGFHVAVPYRRDLASGDVTWGRTRWMPDGQSLLYIGQDAAGRAAVYRQRFAPGVDTADTRHWIVGSLPGAMAESLAVSSDGRYLTVSNGYYVRRLMLAEDVPGVVTRRANIGMIKTTR